uniref:BRCT domain-containing protein n=1 Tax=Panagrolaimus sp. ES5 TaxID=591445 RepID=A0AC34GV40_9BILA
MLEQFNQLYHNSPEANAVKMKSTKTHDFYLFDVPEDKKDSVKMMIKKLGGNVVNNILAANIILFVPSEKQMNLKALGRFLTAAIGGRYLVPLSFIKKSYHKQRFLDVNDYCNLEYIVSKYDLDKSVQTAIKISFSFREQFAKNKFPAFHRQNILFAVPEGEHEDVKLLLEISGAVVHPCRVNDKFFENQLFTLCISNGKIKVHGVLEENIP